MNTAMERQRALKIALTCGAAFALQGCVAAAFPIVAGGLMAGEGRKGPSEAGAEAAVAPAPAPIPVATAAPPPAPDPTPEPAPVQMASAPTTVDPVSMAASEAEASPAPAAPPALPPVAAAAPPAREPAQESTPTNAGVARNVAELADAEEAPAAATTLASSASAVDRAEEIAAVPTAPAPSPVPARTPAPAPTPAPSSAPTNAAPAMTEAPMPPTRFEAAPSGGLVAVPNAVPATAGGTFFDPFFSYASSPEFLMRPGAAPERASAVLVDAAALRPDRVECAQGNSTVLIDLDPAAGKLFPIDLSSASPALADRLAQLRRMGVAIAWISGNTVDKENDIRMALFRSGLDPVGTDDVLLMRSSDERKQLRRDQLAQSSCLIAIAGDERSDFHELFDYLLNPADARALEPLIGEGWFLIPTPLISERAE